MYIEKIFKTNKRFFLPLFYKLLSIGLSWQFLILASGVRAEETQKSRNSAINTTIKFEPPPDGEPPDTAGGTRDDGKCSPEEEKIISLMPEGDFGWTLQENPSVYFYLPKTSAKQVILAFQNESEEYHETAFLPIKSDSGVVSFSLPKDKLNLEVGKNYKWKLTFVCKDIADVDDPEFEGWVKRIDANSVATNLNKKTVIEQVQWYASNGYWYDFLAVLYQARQVNPNDSRLNNIWSNLLKDIKRKSLYNSIDTKKKLTKKVYKRQDE